MVRETDEPESHFTSLVCVLLLITCPIWQPFMWVYVKLTECKQDKGE